MLQVRLSSKMFLREAKFHQKNGKFGEVYKLIQEIIDSAFPKTTQIPLAQNAIVDSTT